VVVAVESQERYWYPDDGGEVWVAGCYPVDAAGRFMSREALEHEGLLVSHVAGATHRPEAVASDEAAPGRPLTLRAEPDNPHDPHAVAVLTAAGESVGYVPCDLNTRVDETWRGVVLRERRDSPRDPRNGLWMLLGREPLELRDVTRG
jgi:HIRAN domain